MSKNPERILGFKVHPAANLFPLLEGTDRQELYDSIKADGLHCPLELSTTQNELDQRHGGKWKHTDQVMLTDGRNRGLIIEQLLAEGHFTKEQVAAFVHKSLTAEFGDEATIDDEWIETHVLTTNLFRRHLTPDQRAMIVAERERHVLEAKAKAAQMAGKADPERAAAQGTDEPKKRAPQTRDKVAKAARVGRDTAENAIKVDRAAEQHPELNEVKQAVRDGSMSMSEAKKQVDKVTGKEPKPKPKPEPKPNMTPEAKRREEYADALVVSIQKLKMPVQVDCIARLLEGLSNKALGSVMEEVIPRVRSAMVGSVAGLNPPTSVEWCVNALNRMKQSELDKVIGGIDSKTYADFGQLMAMRDEALRLDAQAAREEAAKKTTKPAAKKPAKKTTPKTEAEGG